MSELKNELEKCMAGEYYNCHDEIFLQYKTQARKLLKEYHALAYEQKNEKADILRQLFGSIGTNVSVGQPFICDYGQNIYIGNNVSINMNCTFVDCNRITIGDHVLIASNVQLYTATHPVELSDRLTPDWNPESGQYFCRTYALPIRIGSGCWLGGGVIVLPGCDNRRRLCNRCRKCRHERYPGEFTCCRKSLPRDPADQHIIQKP